MSFRTRAFFIHKRRFSFKTSSTTPAPRVRQAAWKPDRVFLVNRVDGQLITPTDIGKGMRVIEGRGF